MKQALAKIRIPLCGISIVLFCSGCGNDVQKKIVDSPVSCAIESDVFTYPLLPPPESVSVVGFAVDEHNLYLTDNGSFGSLGYNNDGRIIKQPIEGGDPVTLATGEIFPHYIALDFANVYWTTESEVRKMPLGGGPSVVLASGVGRPQDIAVDTQFVYWTTNLSQLMRVSIDGGDVTELFAGSTNGLGFAGLALDTAHIYWANRGSIDLNDGSIVKMPIAGGPITTLAMGQSQPARMFVDTTHVYWANAGDFNTNVGLMKLPIDGGESTTLVSTKSQVYAQYASIAGIFVDAKNVYWTVAGSQEFDHYDGTVMRASVAGSASTTIASAVRKAQDMIIVQGCSVYFAAGGNLHRIGLP
jgi:hypothetical protein